MNPDRKGRPMYDPELQMFCDTTHEPNREALRFMRWMAEQGRLEHDVYGPSRGEYAQDDPLDLVGSPRFRNSYSDVNMGGRNLDAVSADPRASLRGAQVLRAPRLVKVQP